MHGLKSGEFDAWPSESVASNEIIASGMTVTYKQYSDAAVMALVLKTLPLIAFPFSCMYLYQAEGS